MVTSVNLGSSKKDKKDKHAHKHRESISSLKDQNVYDYSPTTPVRNVPYDSVSPDGRPMPVEYMQGGRPVSRGDEYNNQGYGGARAPPSAGGGSGRGPGQHSFSSFSSGGRQSLDQNSVYSMQTNTTRGSSIFSQQANEPPTPFSATTFSPNGFSLQKPDDDRVVEAMFHELMIRRGWTRFPEAARQAMQDYSTAKKWMLVFQDKLADWQAEQKRRNTSGTGPDEGTPEWYVKRILDGTIDAKQLQSLSVSLRTQPIL